MTKARHWCKTRGGLAVFQAEEQACGAEKPGRECNGTADVVENMSCDASRARMGIRKIEKRVSETGACGLDCAEKFERKKKKTTTHVQTNEDASVRGNTFNGRRRVTENKKMKIEYATN